MANMKKCDRCGRIYDYPTMIPARRVVDTTRDSSWCDLCVDCEKDLVRFLKNEYVDRRFVIHNDRT